MIENETIQTFSKEQLVHSKRYRNEKDLITVLLKNDKNYSLKEVDRKISKFKKERL